MYTSESREERVDCLYLEIEKKTDRSEAKKKQPRNRYKWTLPKDAMLVFDEAHRCKNLMTANSEILAAAANTTAKILMLSATIACKPETFHLAGCVLGLYPSLRHASNWISNAGKGHKNVMKGVHDRVFSEHGSRMRIRELGDAFPVNRVVAECFDMDAADEIERQYKLIEEEVEKLKQQESRTTGLGKIVKARQKIEMLKVPTYLELARKYLDENLAVAIFVNFTASLRTIAEELKTACVVFGEQSAEERERNIADFNEDRSQVIVCNIQSGGVGISLHDTRGDFPRISVISPSWSAQDVIQSLGVTPVQQRIVCARI
jgi:superfamily II DNA or RNA helicase